jgi:hypothetical protein
MPFRSVTRERIILWCLSILGLALQIGHTEAVTFAPKAFDDLVAESEQIFVGTATQASSRRTAAVVLV